MKKRISIIFALLILLLFANSAFAQGTVTYTKPYLLTLSPSNEMNVLWLSKVSSEGVVEYGLTKELGQTITTEEYKIDGLKTSNTPTGYDSDPANNPELNVFQQIGTLKDLEPNTTYYYQTTTKVDDKIEKSTIYSFKTAPVNGEDFTFALLSDLQLKAESPATVKQIGQQKPDFIIYGGDLQNTPWKAGEWFFVEDCFIAPNELGKTWFEIMQQEEDGSELLQYTPIFVTPGNHEVDDQRIMSSKEMTVNNVDDWSLSIYMQIFRPLYPEQEYYPNGRHWYSADYGDLHISSISAFRWQAWSGLESPGWMMFDDISQGSPQVKWLRDDLKESDAQYKWVNMHWHMVNRGDDGWYPYSEPLVKKDGSVKYPHGDYAWNVLRPLYEKYGVNGVNFGHSHVYERYLINDVNYIEAASIGNNYRGQDDPYHPSGNKPVFEENSIRSFMIITRDENGLNAKGIAASGPNKGQVFDSFTIAK